MPSAPRQLSPERAMKNSPALERRRLDKKEHSKQEKTAKHEKQDRQVVHVRPVQFPRRLMKNEVEKKGSSPRPHQQLKATLEQPAEKKSPAMRRKIIAGAESIEPQAQHSPATRRKHIGRRPAAAEAEDQPVEPSGVVAMQNMLQEAGTAPTTITMITPYLFLGNVNNAMDTEALHKLGITHVLNMAGKEASKLKEYRTNVVANFQYQEFNALDSLEYNISSQLGGAHAFIEQCRVAKGKILVHCIGGVNRSAFVVCAHMLLRGHSLIPLVQQLKRQRSMFLTNATFVQQLVTLAEQLNLLH